VAPYIYNVVTGFWIDVFEVFSCYYGGGAREYFFLAKEAFHSAFSSLP
jgi:hypothetical protein